MGPVPKEREDGVTDAGVRQLRRRPPSALGGRKRNRYTKNAKVTKDAKIFVSLAILGVLGVIVLSFCASAPFGRDRIGLQAAPLSTARRSGRSASAAAAARSAFQWEMQGTFERSTRWA
jgi:hypothetical protein